MVKGIPLLVATALCAALIASQNPGEAVADRSYSVDKAKIELIAVCKASETEAGCWGPDGRSAVLDIERKFKDSFASNNRSLPVVFGRKTRVAVFRISNPAVNHGETTIDTNPQSEGSTGYFDFWPNQYTYDEPHDTVSSVVIQADMNAATGSVYTRIRRTASPSDRIQVREGATLNYLGTTYKIARVAKFTLDPLEYAGDGATRWVIGMTASRHDSNESSVGWVALDESGLSIHAIDKNGIPVFVDPSVLQRQTFPNGQPKSAPSVFPATISQTQWNPQNGDDVLLYTNIDPSKIASIYAVGSSAQRLTITGIPLDRKR